MLSCKLNCVSLGSLSGLVLILQVRPEPNQVKQYISGAPILGRLLVAVNLLQA